jgi:hypothetical protein
MWMLLCRLIPKVAKSLDPDPSRGVAILVARYPTIMV